VTQETILENLKSDNKLYLERLNSTQIVDLKLDEYLRASLDSETDKNTLCKGWDYLKTRLTEPLKSILDNFDYWNKKYNNDKVDDILSYYCIKYGENYILSEELKKQLGSFVYVWNHIKIDCDKKEREQNLKVFLEQDGFTELDTIRMMREEIEILTSEQIDKKYEEHYKKFDGLKVVCVLDVNAIGLLGSFDKKIVKDGKFVYSDYHKALMLIPKKCRTKGHIIKDKCFYKEINRGSIK